MTKRIHHLVVLAGLALLGVGLAWAGTAVGVSGIITGGETTGEMNVASDSLTFKDASGEVMVRENLSTTETVEISASHGEITVTTDEHVPLTAVQRERAREIARANETMSQSLNEMDDVAVSVEPIKKMSADSATQFDVETESSLNESSGTFTVEGRPVETDENSVRIGSAQSNVTYVEDRAVVRIRHAATDELRYSVTVDTANSTVVEITDWKSI